MKRKLLLGVGALAALTLLPDRRTRRSVAPDARPESEGAGPVSVAATAVPRGLAGAPPALVPASVPAPAPVVARRGLRGGVDVVVTAFRTALKGNVTDTGAALAYYAFLAIPATLLIAVGVFGLVAGEGAVDSIVEKMDGVVPQSALDLIRDTLTRVTRNSGGGLSLALIGLLLALWTASGAMSALIRGLNRVHGVEEDRGFARQRLIAAALLGWTLLALAVSFGLLVLGAPLSRALGEAVDAETTVASLWWAAQWPVLIAALLVAFAGILRIGPAGPRHDRRAVLWGALVATVLFVAASGLFAVYVSGFSDYGAAWGSLSAVIVMLTWLWLASIAVLLGGYVEAEIERRTAPG
ncbi:MAG: YihY/virulence factor BrkB family protein [Thermoleophilia bacterium]